MNIAQSLTFSDDHEGRPYSRDPAGLYHSPSEPKQGLKVRRKLTRVESESCWCTRLATSPDISRMINSVARRGGLSADGGMYSQAEKGT